MNRQNISPFKINPCAYFLFLILYLLSAVIWGLAFDMFYLQSAAELINEISILEIEVVHLERYLLSLYRTAFDQYLASLPTNTTQSSRSPVEYQTRPLVQDPNKFLLAHQEGHAANSHQMNGQMDQSHSLKRTEVKKEINCGHAEASPSHDGERCSDTSSDPSLRECPKYVCFYLYIHFTAI